MPSDDEQLCDPIRKRDVDPTDSERLQLYGYSQKHSIRNTHHQTSIKSFFSPLRKNSDSESLRYSAASRAALEDSAAALEDLRTMGDSGVF